MTTPRHHVHIEPWRIGQLHQGDSVRWNGTNGTEIDLAGQDVEGVEGEPDRRVIGAPHHFPRVTVVADVPPPGERLESDTNPSGPSPLAELMEVGRGAIDPAQRVGRHVAADHQKVAAQLFHQVELALGPGKRAAALRFGHPLEITKRLERNDGKSERCRDAADILWRAVERQQIAFEDFDTCEARRCNGLELLGQSAAERYRCDRGLHDGALTRFLRIGTFCRSAHDRRRLLSQPINARSENRCCGAPHPARGTNLDHGKWS